MADDDINESIDDLRAKLEEERTARLEAESRASTAETRAQRSAAAAANTGNEVQQSRLQILDSSLDQLKTQRDIMKARLRDASAEGDHDAVAEISAEMGDVAARLLSLENGKAQLQYQIDNPPRPQPTGDQRQFEQLSPAERVDRIASTLSDKSAAWVRRHPEWAHSQVKVNALVGAHNAALARDHIADTPEYFTEVERILGISADAPVANGRDTDPAALSAASRPVRDAAPPAAPVRAASGGRTRTLSPLEREAAKIAGQTDQEYANAQDALVKEGRITRH
jgi:chromosome segregation ATPase